MAGILFTVGLLLVMGLAHSHGLRLLVSEGPDSISGQVLHAGGAPAAALDVVLRDASGSAVAGTHADGDGRFEFSSVSPFEPPLFVEADAGGGHLARVRARYAAQALTAEASVESTHSTAEIERAIARQITPLREQIAAWEERRSLRDVLGGLGYIIGLAGVGLLILSRRRG